MPRAARSVQAPPAVKFPVVLGQTFVYSGVAVMLDFVQAFDSARSLSSASRLPM